MSSIVGGPLKFAPAESAGVAPQIDDTRGQILVNDGAAAAMFAPEADPYGVPPAPATEPQPDPFAFTPPPIPESIFAAPAAEESAPAWTAPVTSVPEPAPSEPEPAPAWSEPAPDAEFQPAPDAEFQPAPETQLEHGQPGDAEHSKWFDRAKMWASNNLYDPDEDESVVTSDDDHGQDDQHR